MREPNFENLVKILDKKKPDRPTLFELFINNTINEILSGQKAKSFWDCSWNYEMIIPAMKKAGYDYATMHGADFGFPSKEKISDMKTLREHKFIDPLNCDYSRLERAEKLLPKGMKIIVFGSGGVLENVITLVGYENLCIALYDDPEFVCAIFKEVGERFAAYYEKCLSYDCVGAIISNDDWGFNTSTMISVDDMKKYVFPYHKKIVEVAHKHGRQAILHSCGNLEKINDYIINDLKYDGKHSYEDVICPVEEMYNKYKGRIAVLGGIDLDYLCRKTPAEIEKRCSDLMKKVETGYALGSGNSIADYVPYENYAAMIKVVNKEFEL